MDTIDALGPPLSEVSQLHLIGRAALQFAGDLGRANDFLDGEEDRLAFMMAVQAGIVMAESLPEARENGLARPLEKLFQALWDAEQGSKNPLLTPVALYGQPVPDRRKIIQVWAATWVEARYLRGEEDRKSAATTIARLLSDIEISGKRGGDLSKTILEWRGKFEGRRGKDRAIQDRYRRLVEWLRLYPGNLLVLMQGFLAINRHLL